MAWCALPLSAGASASNAPSPLIRYAGPWTFSSNSPGGDYCEMRLRTTRLGKAYRIDVPRACMGVFADSIDIRAWRPAAGDMIVFISRSGRQVLAFRPTGAGPYLARAERGAFVLARGEKLPVALRWGAVGGDWRLKRFGGAEVCQLSLDTDRSGLAGRARTMGGCDRVAAWSFARERLTLKDSGGGTLYRFRRADVTSFQAAGPKAEGFFLVRPAPPPA